MKFKGYLIKEKLGGFSEQIERTAWVEKQSSKGRYDPWELQWKLVNPSTGDDRRNYNIIESIAWKELKGLQRKKVLDYYDDKYNVSKLVGHGGNDTYQAEVQLITNSVAPKELIAELKKLRFKVVK